VVKTLTFLKEAVRANRSTGAIAPSSRHLAEKVTDLAGVPRADVIVEYGPGTGVFTETILRKKKPDARFIAMEVNETFVKATRERCPDATVIHDGAQNAARYLREMGCTHCDAIVSGLPWTNFDAALQDEILDATYDVLAPGGRFVTFAYVFSPVMPAGRRFLLHKLPAKFGRVSATRVVWGNLPPCAVYIADKPRDGAGVKEKS